MAMHTPCAPSGLPGAPQTCRTRDTWASGRTCPHGWAMARWNLPRHTRFAWLASLVLASSTLGRLWFKLSLIPQPDRYALEMDMFLWVAVVFTVWPLLRLIPGSQWDKPHGLSIRAKLALVLRRPALAMVLVLGIACVPIVRHQRRSARWIARPIDIHTTIEYKTAKWLDAHMPGARVFAPGTIGFWLNAFSDAPQLTGGFDNGYHLAQAAKTASERGLLVEKFVVARGGEPLEFGRRVQAEARRRGLGQAPRVYVVADGGVWIWNIVTDRFAAVTGGLDFYHASQDRKR